MLQKCLTITKYVLSKEIEDIILLGCKVHQLQEWEVCIDYFNYQVRKRENKYLIFDAEEVFEKSIRLGYVRRDMQEDIFYLKNKNNPEIKAMPLSKISEHIKGKLGKQLIKSVGNGELSRFRFEFPEPLLLLFQDKDMFADMFFEEEVLVIGHCANELIISWNDVINKKITENCTLKDVIMFQRFFIFINLIADQILFRRKDKHKVVRSLIPAFQPETLIEKLTLFIGDRVKSQELISLFTYRRDIKLDLQYTPLLKVSGGIVFLTSLISKSNLLRNCIAYSYLSNNQTVNRDEREPLVDECEKIFSINHPEYHVFVNKKFSFKIQSGEIDVLVISDSDIIIIECKSPLNPTNNFEMRASFDHLNKASKQLSHCKTAFSDTLFRKSFLSNLGVADVPREIYTCIIFGNRLFNGYTIDTHPIRYVKELDMILNDGYIYSQAGTWRVWQQKKYSHSDLISFISPDYALGIANFESMDKVEQYMNIKEKKVCFETYEHNFVKAIRQYDSYFTVESKDEDLGKDLDSLYTQYIQQFREQNRYWYYMKLKRMCEL